ncbi:isopenicillin N synthase family dioxygenase [Pseudooctadecabacter jejudonensis]|uniref:2-oxoglutarate-dependent ethylene/succinate-forming enzyme n=1 Tax=Pseudooctadecabacter jejudonensis TaxID=1391910 RepID=A0A1Y5SF29_9RHOB|nr:2OG-Fe(II) oxygenase family protein [Pseudooctadecabacter jejudonensis]SLN39355.1 2-oxoglutarate-dependent ethylene/succinate-forming enzyme [Pseudooctadecabacter jejudonensis]
MALATFDLAAFEAAHGAARAQAAADLDAICRDSGFLILEGHGVPEAVIDGIWQAAHAFFAQPADQKARVAPPHPGAPYGWIGPLKEALAASKGVETPPDLKESFNGGPLAVPDQVHADALAFCYQPTPFPNLEGFRPAWAAYYTAMEDLAARIMRAFAAALGLPEDRFNVAVKDPISALRALHYPATAAVADADQQRAGAHTDYGTLTILLPQADRGGLQVQQGGDWVDVTAPEGTFVINIGDLMARWTSDAWVSTLHRVVAKPHQPARKSLAFFHQPGWEVEVAPLDGSDTYPPVLSGPYLMGKFQSTGT